MNPLILLAAPFCGAFVSFFIGRKNEGLRDIFNVLLTAASLIGVLVLSRSLKSGPIIRHLPQLMGTGLDIWIGPLQYLMLLLTAVVWFVTMLFLTQYIPSRKKRNRFHFFFLLTFGSTLGFFMTDNALNQFTFFEILSLSAYFLIIHDEDNVSHEAGVLYLTMAILGGLCALLGILVAYEAAGSLNISDIGRALALMKTERTIAGGLLFFGFAIKAGIFPLHVWLPKAYAAAPSPATAILTGVLSKTGLYGLYVTIFVIAGADPTFGWLAVIVGFITLIHGGLLALLQGNVKHILIYSSMSQYGLILAGIGAAALAGPEGTTALAGAFVHMISHSLFKVLLFLSIGLLYLKTQDLSLNQIHGIGRKSVLLMSTIPIGILSAWGIPGFTGGVSKTMLHEGISHWAHSLPEWGAFVIEGLFLIGSSLTVAYFLKFSTALFLDPPSEFSALVWLKRRMRAAVPMIILGTLTVITGFYPAPMLSIIESGLSADHLALSWAGTAALLPLLIGILIHFLFTRRILRVVEHNEIDYRNPSTDWFSIESNLYTPIAHGLFSKTAALISLMDSGIVQTLLRLTGRWKAVEGGPTVSFSPMVQEMPTQIIENVVPLAEHIPVPSPRSTSPLQPSVPSPWLKLSQQTGRLFNSLLEKSSGLTFALYIFGAFLVALLFILMLQQ